MKAWIALAALAALACSTPYVIRLKSGEILESRDEPELDRVAGFYKFEDASGKPMRVNKDEIVSMEAR